LNPSIPNYPLFFVALAVWAVSELFGGAILPMLHSRGKVRFRRDRASMVMFYGGVGFFFAVVSLLPSSFAGTLPAYLYFVGVSLMFAGVILRLWAMVSLGGSFSLSVVVRNEQKLVEKGPYQSVRHPSYTGIATTIVGFDLALQSWILIPLSAAIFLPILAYRIRVGELMLKQHFGEQYSLYMKRTKRLIPFLL
jgi:protein-S-isoprenylcysteine O-methyltransferase Ste14